jgi:hypothetical protein
MVMDWVELVSQLRARMITSFITFVIFVMFSVSVNSNSILSSGSS